MKLKEQYLSNYKKNVLTKKIIAFKLLVKEVIQRSTASMPTPVAQQVERVSITGFHFEGYIDSW